MKSATLILSLLVGLLLVGCSGGGDTTTQSDIDAATAKMNKDAAGVEPQPDPAIAGVMGGGGSGGAAPKPNKK